MTSTLNLADITTTTTQTYKDVSCNSLIVDGITVNKSTYDDGEYLVTNQFSYDSTNPQNVALKAGTTMNTPQLLLISPTFVKIESSIPISSLSYYPLSSLQASVLNGFTQESFTEEGTTWYNDVTCVTPGNYDVTFTFTCSTNNEEQDVRIYMYYKTASGSEIEVAYLSPTQSGVEYSFTYSAYIATGASLFIYVDVEERGGNFGFSNGVFTINKTAPFLTTSVNSVTATPNNSSLFTLDSSVSNLIIGNNSVYVYPSDKAVAINGERVSGYKLTVNGTFNGNGNEIAVALTGDGNIQFLGTTTSSTPPSAWVGYSTSASSGSTVNAHFGKNNSNYNHGRFRFGYSGSANTGNYYGIDLAGGASLSIFGNTNTYCNSAYLDTSNTAKITFHRIVQTNPNVMALRLSNGAYTYTNASAMLFNSIDSRLDNGTTGTTTLVNTNLGISYSTTTGQFTFTSSTKRYYHISWQIAFNTVENSGYSIEGQIQYNNSSSTKIIGNRTELPYTLISGVLSSICASGVIIGSSSTGITNFKLIPAAIDDAGTAVTSPNSVTITNLNCTSIVITEL